MKKEDKILIQEILKINQKDLDRNRFDIIYNVFQQIDDDSLVNRRDYYVTPLFTNILMKMGINPLNFMDMVPPYYAFGLDIKSIVLPNNIKKIDEYAFAECENLTYVKLSNNLEFIGNGAFEGCKNLKQLNIPKSVKHIEDDAFEGCYFEQMSYK